MFRFGITIFWQKYTPPCLQPLCLSLWITGPTLLPHTLTLTSPDLASPPVSSPSPSSICWVSEKSCSGTKGPEREAWGGYPSPSSQGNVREPETLSLERLRRQWFAPHIVFSGRTFCSDTSYIEKQWRPALLILGQCVCMGTCAHACTYLCAYTMTS